MPATIQFQRIDCGQATIPSAFSSASDGISATLRSLYLSYLSRSVNLIKNPVKPAKARDKIL
jgi:hypothetical protein